MILSHIIRRIAPPPPASCTVQAGCTLVPPLVGNSELPASGAEPTTVTTREPPVDPWESVVLMCYIYCSEHWERGGTWEVEFLFWHQKDTPLPHSQVPRSYPYTPGAPSRFPLPDCGFCSFLRSGVAWQDEHEVPN